MIKLYKINSVEKASVVIDGLKEYKLSNQLSSSLIEILKKAYNKKEPIGLSIDDNEITDISPSFKDRVSEITPCREGYKISFDLGSGIYKVGNDMIEVLSVFSSSLQNEVEIWYSTSPYGEIYDAIG